MVKDAKDLQLELVMSIVENQPFEQMGKGFLKALLHSVEQVHSGALICSSRENKAPVVATVTNDIECTDRAIAHALQVIEHSDGDLDAPIEFSLTESAYLLIPVHKQDQWLLLQPDAHSLPEAAASGIKATLPKLSTAISSSFEIAKLRQQLDEARSNQENSQYKQDQLHIVMQSISDPLIKTSLDGQIEEINLFAEKLLGIKDGEVKSLNVQELFSNLSVKDVNQEAIADLRERLTLGESWSCEKALHFLTMKGKRICLKINSNPITDESDVKQGHVITLNDVTQQELVVLRANWQATHDPLTHLLNRSGFEDSLTELFAKASPKGEHHAVMHLDLDQFKVVNDTCGHQAGDQLLQQVALLIKKELRDIDVVARIGGDEFALVLTNCGPTKALKVSENIRESIAQYRFAWKESVFNPTVSIGLALFDTKLEDSGSVLKKADLARFSAKDNGRNQVQMYQEKKGEKAKTKIEEMEWVSRITKALESDQLVLFCQGIYPLTDNDPTHIEVLVRMREGEDLIPPGAFLPAAERYGKIQALDRWVIDHTIDQLTRYKNHKILKGGYRFNINLSGATLSDETTQKFIATKLRKSPHIASLLDFEITETSAIANLGQCIEFIDNLRGLGCRFALDDFGSGLSSFSYLKQLPVSQIKIDGTFIRDISFDSVDEAIVVAMQQIAEALHIKTVAEFVEDENVIELLRDIGIDFAQGYGLELPLPFDEKLLQISEAEQAQTA